MSEQPPPTDPPADPPAGAPPDPAAEESAAPVRESERITHLDMVRGVAVLGILLMNAVSYGLPSAAYFNLSSAGTETGLDWVIGIFGEIFIDQKMMGIFSMLFGAGIVLFADRAAAKGASAGWLSFWRNLLLFCIGLLHTMLWDGDILTTYAVCSLILIPARNAPPKLLLAAGIACILVIIPVNAAMQTAISPDGSELGDLWLSGSEPSNGIGFYFLFDFFMRALGMMLIGVALFRMGIFSGAKSPQWYRRAAAIGLGVGLPLAALGVVIAELEDYSPGIALLHAIPNTIGTLPAALGFVSLIILWNMRRETRAHRALQAAGRMALTNYLTQSIIGILILRVAFDPDDLSRSWILLFVLCVWALQLLWSPAWLARCRFGPFEYLWRIATYRRVQPLRR